MLTLTTLCIAAAMVGDKITLTESTPGTGPGAKSGELVTVSYLLRIKGQEPIIDKTEGGPPFAFFLGKKSVIAGFDQAVTGMKVGAKRVVEIPPSLGYGDQKKGPIPGGSTLVFEIELHRIDTKTSLKKVEETFFTKGQGALVEKGNEISIHYVGTYLNGIEFDSSRRPGKKPFQFIAGVGQVVAGFDQSVMGKRVGDRFKAVIPYPLAFGEFGNDAIPPLSTLIFDLEIMDVKK